MQYINGQREEAEVVNSIGKDPLSLPISPDTQLTKAAVLAGRALHTFEPRGLNQGEIIASDSLAHVPSACEPRNRETAAAGCSIAVPV